MMLEAAGAGDLGLIRHPPLGRLLDLLDSGVAGLGGPGEADILGDVHELLDAAEELPERYRTGYYNTVQLNSKLQYSRVQVYRTSYQVYRCTEQVISHLYYTYEYSTVVQNELFRTCTGC